jgi:hypothetical protein
MYRIAQNPSFEGGKLSWKVPRNSIAEFHAFRTELALPVDNRPAPTRRMPGAIRPRQFPVNHEIRRS